MLPVYARVLNSHLYRDAHGVPSSIYARAMGSSRGCHFGLLQPRSPHVQLVYLADRLDTMCRRPQVITLLFLHRPSES